MPRVKPLDRPACRLVTIATELSQLQISYRASYGNSYWEAGKFVVFQQEMLQLKRNGMKRKGSYLTHDLHSVLENFRTYKKNCA